MGSSQQKIIQLLVTHHDELVAYISQRFSSRSFADEVVQETCLRLLSKPTDDFEQWSTPLVLLKRISLHLAIDLYRKQQLSQRYVDRSLDCSDWIETAVEHSLTTPELDLAKQQYAQHLIQHIQALPAVCQDVFILTQLHHLSHIETAKQMGMSRAMVAKHLLRAMQYLLPVLFEQAQP
jgi:RNA polymerase sigma factor (sigma-70 family)